MSLIQEIYKRNLITSKKHNQKFNEDVTRSLIVNNMEREQVIGLKNNLDCVYCLSISHDGEKIATSNSNFI
jgi:hypothetical protein